MLQLQTEQEAHLCILLLNIWQNYSRSLEMVPFESYGFLLYVTAVAQAVAYLLKDYKQLMFIELANHLCNKEINSFWKAWRKRFCSKKC